MATPARRPNFDIVRDELVMAYVSARSNTAGTPAPGARIIRRVLWGRATRKADAEAQRATPLKPD